MYNAGVLVQHGGGVAVVVKAVVVKASVGYMPAGKTAVAWGLGGGPFGLIIDRRLTKQHGRGGGCGI